MILKGRNIYLRYVTCDDVNVKYLSWLNDSDVNKYLETRFVPQTLDTIREYVLSLQNKKNEPFFAICLNNSNEHIGNIKFGPINFYHKRAEIALFIGEKQYWGKGFGSEALALVVKYAFEDLNLNKLAAGVYSSNKSSIKIFEKKGFVQEGCLKGEYIISDNKEEDRVVLGLLARDYFSSIKIVQESS